MDLPGNRKTRKIHHGNRIFPLDGDEGIAGKRGCAAPSAAERCDRTQKECSAGDHVFQEIRLENPASRVKLPPNFCMISMINASGRNAWRLSRIMLTFP